MFIIFEGPNGAGKTTLKNRFEGIPGFTTLFSPGSTPLSKVLRPVCRGTDEWVGVDPHLQFLAFSTARTDEYLKHVRGNPNIVITDRWWTSTYVYQCRLQGLSTEFLQDTVHPDERIDMVFILNATPQTLISRMRSERESNPTHKQCIFTREDDTLIKLQKIYEQDLPPYLNRRGIRNKLIDTEYRNADQIFEYVMNEIKIL